MFEGEGAGIGAGAVCGVDGGRGEEDDGGGDWGESEACRVSCLHGDEERMGDWEACDRAAVTGGERLGLW